MCKKNYCGAEILAPRVVLALVSLSRLPSPFTRFVCGPTPCLFCACAYKGPPERKLALVIMMHLESTRIAGAQPFAHGPTANAALVM